jgi:predicted metalloprotease with PDZ domain
MNKKKGIGLAFLLCSCISFAQKKGPFKGYQFTVDLITIKNDQVKVELKTPPIYKKTITYQFPKIVPGAYSEDDYGRYIEQFKAFNKKGVALKVLRKDVNSWTISSADQLYKISYYVNDTYDDYGTKLAIFEPVGSDIQKDTVFVINNHCFLGYFDDMKNIPYEVTINHPSKMYGSTALSDLDNSPNTDRFITESYNRIVDNPFLYDVPDTTVIKVGTTDVLISVYSPHKLVSSKFLAEKLDTLLKAQTKYLGGKLPVDKYAFIIFLDDKPGPSGDEGALEHSYSSFYYLNERRPEELSKQFVSDAAHEFFHIITPLSIHSEEIQYFDFNHPKMSEHLWLYEGSTEYHAEIVQEKYGLISVQDFLNKLSDMITTSRTRYNDSLPFTVMSSGVLGKYKEQFGNVYQKGALIAMCLDIKLLQLSRGKYGFVNLMHDLSMKYGKQKGFKDEELFDEIGKLTFPEIKEFLYTYVSGSLPLPLEQVFNSVGVHFQPAAETKDSAFSMGHITYKYNPELKNFIIEDASNLNALGKTLGFHKNDEIISINGEELNKTDVNNIFANFGKTSKAGDDLIIIVKRKDENGAEKTVELTAKMTKYPILKFNALEVLESPDADQLMLRNFWLKPNGIQIN